MTVVLPLVDTALGNSAYLVDLGDGRGLAVDASRDLRTLRRAAAERGLTVTFAADTHLHADFLSGSRQLSVDGATVVASAAGHRQFPHRAVVEGDEVDLGGLSLRAMASPGHTDEHLSYVLLDGSTPLGVFTGGSLIVGAAARTDLVDPSRAEELARAQYGSIGRLLDLLPDDTAVYPTHGAGSFCAAPPTADRTTTIGRERAMNPLLASRSEDEFVSRLLAAQGSFPSYFLRLAELNRHGPALLRGTQSLVQLDVPAVMSAFASGAQLIDARTTEAFAESHIPGATSIELRDAFATWLGWLVDPARPIVFVRDPDQDADEILWQALKIGLDTSLGELAGGMIAWRSAGQPVSAIPLASVETFANARVLDIRQGDEFASGHVPGAIHVELGALQAKLHSLPTGPLAVMCGHGERAMTAASLLEQHGRRDVAVLHGAGAADWSEAMGQPLEVTG